MGIEMSPHLRYQQQGMHDIPVVHRHFFWQPGRGVFTLDEEGSDSLIHAYLKDLQILQYDVSWGEGYSLWEWNTDASLPSPGRHQVVPGESG
jgi:hypothetical protein